MKQCLFCDATSLTKEHIFPDWIVQRYEQRTRGRGTFNASFSKWDGIVKRWSQPTITQKKALLCKSCNNVKLGSVEHEVSPLLIPYIEDGSYEHAIGRTEQLALSVWIVARAMIWDGIAPLGRRFYTQSQRIAFSDSDPLTLPPNTQIWLGLHLGSPYRAAITVGNQLVNDDDGFNVTTAVIGHVAMQLVAWKGKGWRIHTGRLRSEGWETATKQIWPLRRRAVQWPPPAHLDREGLKALAKRFGSRATVFES